MKGESEDLEIDQHKKEMWDFLTAYTIKEEQILWLLKQKHTLESELTNAPMTKLKLFGLITWAISMSLAFSIGAYLFLNEQIYLVGYIFALVSFCFITLCTFFVLAFKEQKNEHIEYVSILQELQQKLNEK